MQVLVNCLSLLLLYLGLRIVSRRFVQNLAQGQESVHRKQVFSDQKTVGVLKSKIELFRGVLYRVDAKLSDGSKYVKVFGEDSDLVIRLCFFPRPFVELAHLVFHSVEYDLELLAQIKRRMEPLYNEAVPNTKFAVLNSI